MSTVNAWFALIVNIAESGDVEAAAGEVAVPVAAEEPDGDGRTMNVATI